MTISEVGSFIHLQTQELLLGSVFSLSYLRVDTTHLCAPRPPVHLNEPSDAKCVHSLPSCGAGAESWVPGG